MNPILLTHSPDTPLLRMDLVPQVADGARQLFDSAAQNFESDIEETVDFDPGYQLQDGECFQIRDFPIDDALLASCRQPISVDRLEAKELGHLHIKRALLHEWSRMRRASTIRCVKKKQKARYRIHNWREYNAALVQRGSLTLWVDEAAVAGWHNHEKSGCRGASRTYSDSAIVCALTLQGVYRLPLRATEGLLRSLLRLMQVELPTPDFSTLCRRRQTLEVALLARPPKGRLHLLVDASGFKVYGEGEWKVRQHGYSKRRTWRKLHIGIDEATGEVVAAMASTNDLRDDALSGDLLSQVPGEIEQVSGDGIYDTSECYRLLQERGARAAIPPRRGARKSPKPELAARNAHLRRIQQLSEGGEDGRKRWKQEVNYHRRSLVETAFFRLKTLMGNTLSARHFQAQANELFLRCAALNRMTQLGMPQSYPI